MRTPRATYRLQFRNGMDFDGAIAIIPYLKNLGISHLYASPLFTAVNGSTHGYDVTNANEIDPSLGGGAGFDRLSRALREAGLGLIIDIVPNHMAASLENRWWRSVVEWGRMSPYSGHFDIDWSRRLTLPILGKPLDQSIVDGDIKLAADREQGCIALSCPGHLLPLSPPSYELALGDPSDAASRAVGKAAVEAVPGNDAMHDRIRSILADERSAKQVEEHLRQRTQQVFLKKLHDEQPYRLMFWRNARTELNYRRFFEITGLVGMRVEDDAVFKDIHRLTFELVRSRAVDGLRVDHIDGLADPKGYLERLRGEVGENIYLVVEKILERGETLPAGWPVDGTTGYEFVDSMAGLLADRDGVGELGAAYAKLSGVTSDVDALTRQAKRNMLMNNFEGEVRVLVHLACQALENVAESELRAAIVELVAAFPVYRTYGRDTGMDQHDRAILAKVAATARRYGEAGREAIEAIFALLAGDSRADKVKATAFRTRFQQLTGPVMAKAVEDTLFYRFNALICLNEVGGHPELDTGGIETFHHRMKLRAQNQARTMSTTATHDTKRGEDARARLYAVSEIPAAWCAAVERWRKLNAGKVVQVGDGAAPEPAIEWLLYQALAGIWPTGSDIPDKETLQSLSARFVPYVEKALREAKLRTDWLDINESYETSVKTYALWLLSPENRGFLTDFAATMEPIVQSGILNSLSQTLIKMTAPGVPDIYQGTEIEDFSLVDPDNRRPVDFLFAQESLFSHESAGLSYAGLSKQRLVTTCLRIRASKPQLFSEGNYLPLPVKGKSADHAIAYCRHTNENALIVVAPRLTLEQTANGTYQASMWGDTTVQLPQKLNGTPAIELLRVREFIAGSNLALSELATGFPMVCCVLRL